MTNNASRKGHTAISVNFTNVRDQRQPDTTRAWSQEQSAIFDWFATGRGNLVVRARAGTGKTTTILEGVERAPEQAILLAAFNKSIATELQSRIRNPRVEAKTLHALGFKFVMRNWNGVKVDSDGERAKTLSVAACGANTPDPMVKLVALLHTKAREIVPFARSGAELVDLAAQFNLMPEQEWEEEGWDTQRVCDAAHRAMGLAKARPANDLIDFSDMIYLPLVNDWVRPWFNMVVVDEAQDMTIAQLTLAMRCCKRGGRICVVGDDRQAIYAFRGADSESLDRLKTELKAQELGLTTTYRCGKVIVALAATLVPDFRAASTASDGVIVNISRDAMEEGAKEGDFILSRTNAPLIKVCMALLKRNVRARIKGRDIGKGLLALIRKLRLANLTQLSTKLVAWAEKEMTRARAKLSEMAAAARCDFIQDQVGVLEALAEDLATVAELEARIGALFSDDAEKGAVMCSTVHRAKGLEAHRVYLLAETFKAGKVEEDNIRYVGITRAKAELAWVSGFAKA